MFPDQTSPKRNTALFLIILLLLIGSLLWVYNLIKDLFYTPDPAEQFASTWGVTLPEGSDLLFSNAESSFHGDGYHYSVWSVDAQEESVQVFLTDFYGYSALSSEAAEFFRQGIAALKITAPNRPSSLQNCLFYFHITADSQLLLLYEASANRLYCLGFSI